VKKWRPEYGKKTLKVPLHKPGVKNKGGGNEDKPSPHIKSKIRIREKNFRMLLAGRRAIVLPDFLCGDGFPKKFRLGDRRWRAQK